MGQPCPFVPVKPAKDGTGCRMIADLRAVVDLTPEQEQKLTDTCKQFAADEEDAVAELRTKRNEFNRMLVAGDPTKAQIAAKVDEIAALQSRLMLKASDRVLSVKSILTPTQRKVLLEESVRVGPMCLGRGAMQGAGCMMGGDASFAAMAARPTRTTDPVCGATVDTKGVQDKSSYGARTYHFCSAACKSRFDKDPGQYVK
jgi:YHS domain-containing protein/Spy/CpxP family protein refolding chaperone